MNGNNEVEDGYMLLPNRRRFVQGLAAGGAMAALDSGGWLAFGKAAPRTLPTLAAGYVPRPDLWERYLAGPESGADPLGWRTKLSHRSTRSLWRRHWQG